MKKMYMLSNDKKVKRLKDRREQNKKIEIKKSLKKGNIF
jgi:hypothetical protein